MWVSTFLLGVGTTLEPPVLGNQVLLLLAPVGRSLLDVVGKGHLPSATLTFDLGLLLCPHFLGCLLEAAAFMAALSWAYLVLFPI